MNYLDDLKNMYKKASHYPPNKLIMLEGKAKPAVEVAKELKERIDSLIKQIEG